MKFLAILLLLSSIFTCAQVLAENTAIEGLWQSTDENTGEALSVVHIWSENELFYGKVQKLLDPKRQGSVCGKCQGDLKDAPIKGLQLLTGLSKNGDSWSGGTILEPKSGKTYKVILSLQDEGRELKVRGYLGIPSIGKTRIWTRYEAESKPESIDESADESSGESSDDSQ